MHVLIIPSGYPMEGKPYRGIFYKEQAMALSRAGYQVTVAFSGDLEFESILVGATT